MKPQPTYGPEEHRLALEAVALYDGDCGRAKKLLDRSNLHIDRVTLKSWTKRFPDLYAEIVAETAPARWKRTAARSQDLAAQYMELGGKLADQIDKDLDDNKLKPSEKPKALQSVSISAGIQLTKTAEAQQRPTMIVERRDPEAALKKLVAMFPKFIEAEAQDVTDEPAIEAGP